MPTTPLLQNMDLGLTIDSLTKVKASIRHAVNFSASGSYDVVHQNALKATKPELSMLAQCTDGNVVCLYSSVIFCNWLS